MSSKIPTYPGPDGGKKEGRRAYTLTVALPRGASAFKLTRKRERASTRSKYPPCRAVVDVTPDGEAECVCISVDAEDRLYVTDDYVVTHNTFTSLLYAWRFLPDDPPGPVVVVCPSHLKLNWRNEAYKHLGLRVEILEGRSVPPDKLPPRDPNSILILNYDILVPHLWNPRAPLPKDSWAGWVAGLNPRLVIGDEAHALSNPDSARTRAFRRLTRNVKNVLLLTATPLANNVMGMWSLCRIVRPDLFQSRFDFGQRYTHARHRWYGWVFKGARNLDELNRVLCDHVMVRRRKADVLSELPPVTHTVIPVEVDLAEYRRAEDDFLGWLASTDPRAPRRAAKAQEISRMTHLKILAARLKVDAVRRWADGLLEETGGKLLLGAMHYAVTGPLMDHFGRSGVLVDGRMTAREKDAAFHRFNKDPECRVLVGNIQAAGTGWNCTSTSDAALCELPWRPGDVAQFVGRVDGIERGLPGATAHLRYLVAEGTIEEDICEVLQRKAGWASKAVDGFDGDGGLDVHDQVKELVKRRRG